MNTDSSESSRRLERARAKIAALERAQDSRACSGAQSVGHPGRATARFALGHDGIDAALQGGLERGRLHEIFAASPGDAPTAAGFALMLARCAAAEGPILWVRHRKAAERVGAVYGAGVNELGLDPNRFVFVLARDIPTLLRSADDILRCDAVGTLIAEAWGEDPDLSLTASRRMALAAEKSGVNALLLRSDARPAPSSATTRWGIRAIPSTPLEADAPGHPALELSLLRHRSGSPGQSWRVEWDRDRHIFRDSPLPGAMVPVPADGAAADRGAGTRG